MMDTGGRKRAKMRRFEERLARRYSGEDPSQRWAKFHPEKEQKSKLQVEKEIEAMLDEAAELLVSAILDRAPTDPPLYLPEPSGA